MIIEFSGDSRCILHVGELQSNASGCLSTHEFFGVREIDEAHCTVKLVVAGIKDACDRELAHARHGSGRRELSLRHHHVDLFSGDHAEHSG